MPENEMTEVDETRDGQAGAPVAETRAQKYEREQLSRRAALRRMGYTSALAAFALFGVDDVVRLVGRRMQRQAGDSRVAELVAQELQQLGLARASGPGQASPTQGQVTNWSAACDDCETTWGYNRGGCETDFDACTYYQVESPDQCQADYNDCQGNAYAYLGVCLAKNNCQ